MKALLRRLRCALGVIAIAASLAGLAAIITSYWKVLYQSVALGDEHKVYAFVGDGRITMCIASVASDPLMEVTFKKRAILRTFESHESLVQTQAEVAHQLDEVIGPEDIDGNGQIDPVTLTRDNEAMVEIHRTFQRSMDNVRSRHYSAMVGVFAGVARSEGLAGILIHADPDHREDLALSFPPWLLFGLFSLAPGILFIRFIRRWRRVPLHACRRCRYDLTGNDSGVCPECGSTVPEEQRKMIAAPMANGQPDEPSLSGR